jgi:hypothetical protein
MTRAERDTLVMMSRSVQLAALERFLFRLTITGRMLRDSTLALVQINEAFGQINEINHRVLNCMCRLRDQRDGDPIGDLFEEIDHHVSLAPGLEPEVSTALGWAVQQAQVDRDA